VRNNYDDGDDGGGDYAGMADPLPTWTQLYQRLSELEAEMTLQSTESRGAAARLERECSRATKRETELTKQLRSVELKLKRTERMLIKPGEFKFNDIYSSPKQVISQLRGVTCRIGSHSVTFHPTQVNAPRLTPAPWHN